MTVSTTISYPVGVKALLPEEAARRRKIERSIVDSIEGDGYREVILPIVDFVDPYSALLGERSTRQSYRFTDREGELIQIRSDFTPMLARALAPAVERGELPLRVFYRGDVIRYEQTRLGRNREFFQIGAEMIGPPSTASDIEMLKVAAGAVIACGARPTITCTDATLLDDLLRGASIEPGAIREIRRAVANKHRSEIRRFASTLEPDVLDALDAMAAGRFGIEQLKSTPSTAATAERLEEISSALASVEGANFELHVDDVDEERGYYSGVRFRIFTDVRRLPVGHGGRYDELYPRFGANTSAVGFTLSVDYLEELS